MAQDVSNSRGAHARKGGKKMISFTWQAGKLWLTQQCSLDLREK